MHISHGFSIAATLRIVAGMSAVSVCFRSWPAAAFRLRYVLRALLVGLPLLLVGGCESLHTDGGGEPRLSEPAAPVDARPLPPLPRSKPARRPASQANARPAEEHKEGAPAVVGLSREGLLYHFGQPAAEREAPPARVLEFGGEDCRLAAYLYFDTARNDFYALQYEVNGSVGHSPAADRCLARIARDARQR